MTEASHHCICSFCDEDVGRRLKGVCRAGNFSSIEDISLHLDTPKKECILGEYRKIRPQSDLPSDTFRSTYNTRRLLLPFLMIFRLFGPNLPITDTMVGAVWPATEAKQGCPYSINRTNSHRVHPSKVSCLNPEHNFILDPESFVIMCFAWLVQFIGVENLPLEFVRELGTFFASPHPSSLFHFATFVKKNINMNLLLKRACTLKGHVRCVPVYYRQWITYNHRSYHIPQIITHTHTLPIFQSLISRIAYAYKNFSSPLLYHVPYYLRVFSKLQSANEIVAVCQKHREKFQQFVSTWQMKGLNSLTDSVDVFIMYDVLCREFISEIDSL